MLYQLLANQKIVIVGASSGIGLAIAKAVVQAGSNVVLASRSIEKLQQRASDIGDRSVAIPVDITDEASVQTLFEK